MSQLGRVNSQQRPEWWCLTTSPSLKSDARLTTCARQRTGGTRELPASTREDRGVVPLGRKERSGLRLRKTRRGLQVAIRTSKSFGKVTGYTVNT